MPLVTTNCWLNEVSQGHCVTALLERPLYYIFLFDLLHRTVTVLRLSDSIYLYFHTTPARSDGRLQHIVSHSA